jgi:hypothetical protein
MFNKRVVQKVLKRTWELDKIPGLTPDSSDDHSSVTSQLIHDLFGGEILKTHKKKNWHFYNRINGERVDFTGSEMGESSKVNDFEDIPSSPDETYDYIDQVDYSTFFMRFVKAFEEAIGLEKYLPGLTT